MDILATIASTVFEQMQKPTLAFLIMGVLLAALGSKFEIHRDLAAFEGRNGRWHFNSRR